MKIKDGFRYDTNEFADYKLRVKFVAENEEGNQVVNTDVYTDNLNKEEIETLLCNNARKKGWIVNRYYTGVVNFSTKEQDDNTAEFLDEILKDI